MLIPVPAQNSCLREYVNNRNGIYILPILESCYENCFHQLFDILDNIPSNGQLIMYSVTMLPNADKAKYFFDKCAKKNISLIFVLENLISQGPFLNLKKEIENYKIGTFECSGDYLNEIRLLLKNSYKPSRSN